MKKLVGIAALAVLGAGVFIAAGAQGGKPIVVASNQPASLAPGKISDGNSIFVQDQIYDRLLEFKAGTTDVEPSLALSVRPNATSSVWTISLRPGVSFQDGTAFNADAVKFNFDFWWDNTRPTFHEEGDSIVPEIFGDYKSSKNATSLIKTVEVVNGLTVKVTLSSPVVNFDELMATGYFGMASPTAIKKAGEDKYGTASTIPVGTGPYSLKSWQTGDRIVLEANKNYWRKGFPKNPGAIVRFITDAAARIAELRAGNVDLLPTGAIPYDNLTALKADANVTPVFLPSFNVGYLGFNQAKTFNGAKNPLADLKVRQAIAAAINKKAIVDAFYGEYGITNPFIPPTSLEWTYSKNVKDYVYSVEAAKKLLADAGYKDGFSMELWYMPVSRPYFPNAKPLAEAMAKDLAAVGIKAELKTKDWGAYLADVNDGKLQAFMLGWTGDYNDPDNFYTPLIGPGTVKETGYDNAAYFKLLEQGRGATNKAQKTGIYQQISEILYNDIVKLPIVHSKPLQAKRANVDGWVPSPLGSVFLADLSVK
jgi:peptide/nickel transport system substrate-binding protein